LQRFVSRSALDFSPAEFILLALHWFKMGQDIEYKTIEAVLPRRFFRILGLLVSNSVRGISLAVI
jgi:hypothetical protein